MPASGGKAYLLVMQDIQDLLDSPEYRGVVGVDASEMGVGFTVPGRMLHKMRLVMESMRTGDSPSKASDNLEQDSRPASSVDKRDDGDDGLTGDDISNIMVNSTDVPSTVASPASSCKPFSPAVDEESPLTMDHFL